ncbi:MAG: hypothetical protein [Chaetfec virus UA24_144]|nr:MAG: hypothetical protein [Chaetfec virus UA24_144]
MGKKETVVGVARITANFAACVGVGQVVSNIVAATMPPQASIFVKGASTVGLMVISGMAGKVAGEYAESVVIEVANIVENFTQNDEPEYVTP